MFNLSIILTLVIGGVFLYGAYLIVQDKQAEWEIRKKIREANKMADRFIKQTQSSNKKQKF